MFEEHGGAERRRTRGIDVRSRLKSTKGAPDGVGATCVSMAVDCAHAQHSWPILDDFFILDVFNWNPVKAKQQLGKDRPS